jgi:hypothetical protein
LKGLRHCSVGIPERRWEKFLKSEKPKTVAEKRALRWQDIPHAILEHKALSVLMSGSASRGTADALRYVLKCRLPDLIPADHEKYVEVECQRIVESLRLIRDEYRKYLQKQGCRPLAEMHWVVFRFAITGYAVKMLRNVASNYLSASAVDPTDWQILYGTPLPSPVVPLSGQPVFVSKGNYLNESVQDTITRLIKEDTFTRILRGGPFGKEGQIFLARNRLTGDFLEGTTGLWDSIAIRQEFWEQCRPWTAGLATLFDTTQNELFAQMRALSDDVRKADFCYLSFSTIERIVHKHLISMRENAINSKNLGAEAWGRLFSELDENAVSLNRELTGRPKDVLRVLKNRHFEFSTWTQAFDSHALCTLENGRTYRLRRELQRFIQNIGSKLEYRFNKR